MRAHQGNGHFDFGPEREAHERIWTREAYDVLTESLFGLPVHWRFFVKSRIFEAVARAAAGSRMAPAGGSTTVLRAAIADIVKKYPQIRT